MEKDFPESEETQKGHMHSIKASIRSTKKETLQDTHKDGENNGGMENTAVSDIPEGCVLVGPRNARFFTFSDRLLTILHSIYLVSNKVTSNRTKTAIFLHISYIYLRTCHPSSPTFELLKIGSLGRWKKVSKTRQTVLRKSNTTRNVRVFTLF